MDALGSTLSQALSDVLAEKEQDCVDFVTFVRHKDYMNCGDMWDWWADELRDYSTDERETILTGSTGGGKSFVASLLVCYRVYRLFSMGDFRKVLGLAAGTPIYLLYFSVSLKMAEKSGFSQLRNLIDASPWFVTHFPRKKELNSSIAFSNGVSIDYASGESHQIGLNIFGFILDEANFRSGVGKGSSEEYSEVQQLAQQLDGRIRTRFTRGGVVMGFSIYVSSAAFASSFIEEKVLDAKSDPTSRVVQVVEYKVRPANHATETFEVFCGHAHISPCVVESVEHRDTLKDSTGLPSAMAEDCFEQVPADLTSQFRKNIYLAIQNFCGRATAMRGSFITNYAIVSESYDYELTSPFVQSSVIASNLDDIPLSSYIKWDVMEYMDRPHTIYLDLSLSGDSGSLSCVRLDGIGDDGRMVHTHVFTLEILPPAFPGVTRISKIEDFILAFAERVNLAVFGSDNFQSESIRQNISAELDLPNIRVSLDSTDAPHLLWLSALVDKRFRMQYVTRLDLEIREAVHDLKRHKVVKREGSSDDQFQSVVGAFYLSDSVAGDYSFLESLSGGDRLNLVGSRASERISQSLGYSSAITRRDYGRVMRNVRRVGMRSTSNAFSELSVDE